ncbi:hypothetical protein ATHL_00967, partial [Anaerolinea thermolimosa]
MPVKKIRRALVSPACGTLHYAGCLARYARAAIWKAFAASEVAS